MKNHTLFLLCFTLIISTIVNAKEYHVKVYNQIEIEDPSEEEVLIHELYIAPSSHTKWGKERLNNNSIRTGEVMKFSNLESDSPYFDVKAISVHYWFNNRACREYTVTQVNLKEEDIHIGEGGYKKITCPADL